MRKKRKNAPGRVELLRAGERNGPEWTYKDPRQFDSDLSPADRRSRICEVETLTQVFKQLLASPDISELERERLQAYLDFCLQVADYVKRTVKEIEIREWLEKHYGA